MIELLAKKQEGAVSQAPLPLYPLVGIRVSPGSPKTLFTTEESLMIRFMVLVAVLVILSDAGDIVVALFANALYDLIKRR